MELGRLTGMRHGGYARNINDTVDIYAQTVTVAMEAAAAWPI